MMEYELVPEDTSVGLVVGIYCTMVLCCTVRYLGNLQTLKYNKLRYSDCDGLVDMAAGFPG